MRHIMVLNAKGGSGKTTIATNLASYFASQEEANVILADFDQQASSMSWLQARSPARAPIRGVSAVNHSLHPQRNTDYIIMDAPAAAHGPQLTALIRHAETLIVPVLPSPIDMRAAADYIKELKKVGKVDRKEAKLVLVGNRGRDFTNIYWELDEFLSKQRIPFLTILRESMNYVKAAERGLGIFEMGAMATDYDRELWEPIIKWVSSKRSQP